MSKPCIKCGATDRYESGDCRSCAQRRSSTRYIEKTEECKKSILKYRMKHPDYMQIWRQDNCKWIKQYKKEYEMNNPEVKQKSDAKYRNNNREKLYENDIKRRYGLTLKEREQLLLSQNSQCAICSTSLSVFGRNTHIDHNHDTGKVRGILCNGCNGMLGWGKDNPEVLRLGAIYLEKSNE